MQMTCPKCGAEINPGMKFCRKCGAPLQNVMQGQPNAQGQPNMYGQENTQGQPNMYGQQNTQGQPNMYGQGNTQGQPNMYGQQNAYGQPDMYGQPQMQYGTVKPKKKSGLLMGIGAGVLVLAVLAAGGFFAFKLLPGFFKDPKTLFAENIVSVTRNFSEEFKDFGTKPVEAMVHLGIDDAKDSHTTTKITTVESSTSKNDQEYALEQTYSYDSGSGDSSYILSVNMGDSSLGTGGVYYNGNEFIFAPASTTSPMVRYEMDESVAKSLGAYQTIDRYTLMLKGMSSENTVDWDKQLADFLEGPLEGIDKEEFEKSKEDYTVFGKTCECDAVSITVTGQEAADLFEGMTKLITVGISNGDNYDTKEIFGESKEDDSFSLKATTYSYKNSPVGVVISISKDTESQSINLSGYSSGNEKQVILDVPSDKGKAFYYEDGVYSIDSGYRVLNKIDFGELSIVVDETGTINGQDRDLNGSLTINAGDKAEKIHLKENSFTGSISQKISDGRGQLVTEIKTKEGHAKITTSYERGKLQEDKLKAPVFLPESGIDCGRDLDVLKENIHSKMLGDKGNDSGFVRMGNRNSLVRLGYIISLIVRNR